MLEANNLKKLVDQELPFEPMGVYVPIKKCLHGEIICKYCAPSVIPVENQL